jgi:hypothetical protein
VDDDDLFDEDYVKSCNLVKAMKDPLVPEDCTEPYEVLQCFTHSFELRYGAMHPLFLLGSLADVVAEATSSPRTVSTIRLGDQLHSKTTWLVPTPYISTY